MGSFTCFFAAVLTGMKQTGCKTNTFGTKRTERFAKQKEQPKKKAKATSDAEDCRRQAFFAEMVLGQAKADETDRSECWPYIHVHRSPEQISECV